MEEDIKILEEKKANCIKGMMKGAIYTDEKAERKAIAIENLIKGYRELEERTKKNIEPVLVNNKMYFIDKELYEDLLKDIKTNYILKSKIKEKIEELETKLKVFEKDIRYCKDRVQARLMNDEIYVLRRCMDLLKELMEDK